MSWADWLLLSLVAGWILFILLRRPKRSCCGNCSHCSGCRKGKK